MDSILHHSLIGLPCKRTAEGLAGNLHFTPGINDHRHQGDRPVVMKSCGGGFLGNHNDGGVFETGWVLAQLKGFIKDECVELIQLVRLLLGLVLSWFSDHSAESHWLKTCFSM